MGAVLISRGPNGRSSFTSVRKWRKMPFAVDRQMGSTEPRKDDQTN